MRQPLADAGTAMPESAISTAAKTTKFFIELHPVLSAPSCREIHRASDCSEAVAACESARCGGIDIANASDSSTVKKIQA